LIIDFQSFDFILKGRYFLIAALLYRIIFFVKLSYLMNSPFHAIMILLKLAVCITVALGAS